MGWSSFKKMKNSMREVSLDLSLNWLVFWKIPAPMQEKIWRLQTYCHGSLRRLENRWLQSTRVFFGFIARDITC
jgi:hypothetical protein